MSSDYFTLRRTDTALHNRLSAIKITKPLCPSARSVPLYLAALQTLCFPLRQPFFAGSLARYPTQQHESLLLTGLPCADTLTQGDMLAVVNVTAFHGDHNSNRTPLVVNNVNRHVLKPLCKKLGIPIGTTHAFRHGRISVLQQNNVPGDLIKKWVGHTSLKTTSKYAHFPTEFRRKVVSDLAKNG